MKRSVLALLVTSCCALIPAFGAPLGCKSSSAPAKAPSATPTLRIYAVSTIAGALEPCGCVKNMLGGVDHAAALIEKGKAEASHALVLGAGPMFFLNPTLSAERSAQDLWKAESIAESMLDIGLAAWAPGANDFAAGAAKLAELRQRSHAALLAANVRAEGVETKATEIVDVGGYKLGLTGVSLLPSTVGAQVSDAKAALVAALGALQQAGAQIKVALIAGPRGEALRLAERVPGFTLFILGKALDQGESNDAPIAPVLVGETLVVQAANHMQAVAVVDLFVRDGVLSFRDGTGIELQEKRESLERRAADLGRRIETWKKESSVKAEDLNARQNDLLRLKQELSQISNVAPPAEGSFFRYDLNFVREDVGTSSRVAERMKSYYRRVNDHNRETFKDLKPEPVADGQAHYVGMDECSSCHEDAEKFWRTTGHAKAYKTLADEFKEFNLDCVSCHVTGYDKPGGSTVTWVSSLKDVQCEECHGPGSKHVDDQERSSIVLDPGKALCQKCHHEPHVHADWSAEEAWTHIIGPGHGAPLPADQAAGAPTK